MKKLIVPVGLLAFILACDAAVPSEEDFEGEAIDCTWFADTTNCWASAVQEAAACTDSAAAGIFSEDRSSCLYDSGAEVKFQEPLPEFEGSEQMLAHNWDAEILAADTSSCAQLTTSTLGGMSLTVGSGAFMVDLVGLTGLQFTCPSGDKYYIQNALEQLDCALDMPGVAVSEGADGAVSVSLNTAAAAEIDDTEVFTCAPAEGAEGESE